MNPIDSLTKLGFTPLEAQAYTFVLQNAGVTGYRVAQALGKAAANVYKAIESLEAKGALIVEQDKQRRVRAVPPDELLDQLENSFRQRKLQAKRALADVPQSPEDDRVYRLGSREQVLARIGAMLQRCQHNVLLDLSPKPLQLLAEDLAQLTQRGIDVALRCEEPMVIEGVDAVAIPDIETDLEPWPGEWLNLVVDGKEHLIALFSDDTEQLHQAVWSGSTYLSWVYYSGLSCEIILDALLGQMKRGTTVAELEKTVEHYVTRMWTSKAPGRRILVERFLQKRSVKGKG